MSKIITLEYATTTPCRVLKTLPDDEKDQIADLIVDHYYKIGFPYYELTKERKFEIARKMKNFKSDSLDIGENEIQQNMFGLNFVNFYHPQMWEVDCNNSMSPMEIFKNPVFFKRSILKRIQYCNTKLQPFNIRKSLMVFRTQRVSNFRPTVAKYIYDRYCPENGIVLDPCAGYGGRLFGAWASDNVKFYIGVDPDDRQIRGNANMVLDLHHVESRLTSYLKRAAFEDFKGAEQSYDLIFTSPPYFDTERYAYDKKQSWMRYREYDKWVDKFLTPLIQKSHLYLRKNCYFVLNVGSPITEDAVRIGNEVFGEYVEVLQMRLSRVLGSHNPNKFKLEPIYIWRKS